jgi:hypothetical protein
MFSSGIFAVAVNKSIVNDKNYDTDPETMAGTYLKQYFRKKDKRGLRVIWTGNVSFLLDKNVYKRNSPKFIQEFLEANCRIKINSSLKLFNFL